MSYFWIWTAYFVARRFCFNFFLFLAYTFFTIYRKIKAIKKHPPITVSVFFAYNLIYARLPVT